MGSWPIYEGTEKSLEREQDEEEFVDGFSFQGQKEMPLGDNNGEASCRSRGCDG